MQDVFFLDKEHYTQGLNPVKSYIEQLSFYIKTTKGYSDEQSKAKAIEIFKSRFKDRGMKCFERQENGDRVVKTTTVKNYIYDNLKQENIITPTLTTYMPRKRKVSILSEFIFVSVAKRSKAKKEAHRYKAEGNILMMDNKNNEQNNLKTYNNSMSGSFAQEACILYNPANHSTLTSITRTMTSLSNANNERIIAGNRYYPREIDVFNNIIYIASTADTETVRKAIQHYGLVYPTVSDTVAVLKRSSDLYFHNHQYYIDKIIPLLSKLTPDQLAAVCYVGDFYHIRKFNPEFVKNLLDNLTVKIRATQSIEGCLDKLKAVDENLLNFIHHIFFTELKGKGKDYDKMSSVPMLIESILLTAQHAQSQLMNYKEFFNSFFMTSVMPNNAFRLKNMRRRTVVLSDTDSTCFTLDEWVKWYNNDVYQVTDRTIAVGGAVAYITTQVIVNLLRVLSRNLNIDPELIDKLGMKNEFLWLTHVPADVSKHYFAYTVIQEGSILNPPEIEIKGVHLKNSAVPKFVIDDGKSIMEGILTATSSNKPQSLNEIIKRIVDLENSIRNSILKGEPVFLKRSKIKTADSYAEDATRSPFARHTFWESVFAFKYGEFPPPPYDVIKIPTVVTSKTSLNEWFASIKDEELLKKLQAWFVQTGKKDLPTFYMNEDFVSAYGIPTEIMSIIDIKRIVLDVTIQHRVILESCGVMLYKDKLVSEQFTV